LNGQVRYFVRSADGGSIASYGDRRAAERAALDFGQGSHVVDTQAPVYVPMIQQVVDGELRILGVGGWGADRLSPTQNFLQAIKRKQLAIVHAFLAAGADPDARDDRGRPAIIWAVASGRPEIVEFLLEQGADPDATDPEGTTALSLASERGANQVIAVLEARRDGPRESLTPG
jgi:hypothetical protein